MDWAAVSGFAVGLLVLAGTVYGARYKYRIDAEKLAAEQEARAAQREDELAKRLAAERESAKRAATEASQQQLNTLMTAMQGELGRMGDEMRLYRSEVRDLRAENAECARERAEMGGELRVERENAIREAARADGMVAEVRQMVTEVHVMVEQQGQMIAGNTALARGVKGMLEEQGRFHADHSQILRYHQAHAEAEVALLEHLELDVPEGLR